MEKLLILLVEDDPDDEFLAIRALHRVGLENLAVVRNGEEALTYLLDTALPLPDLILLDLKLPKINGIDVLKVIRSDERTDRIPVIITSSSREESDLACCRNLGVLSFISKPLDGKRIVGILHGAGILKDRDIQPDTPIHP